MLFRQSLSGGRVLKCRDSSAYTWSARLYEIRLEKPATSQFSFSCASSWTRRCVLVIAFDLFKGVSQDRESEMSMEVCANAHAEYA